MGTASPHCASAAFIIPATAKASRKPWRNSTACTSRKRATKYICAPLHYPRLKWFALYQASPLSTEDAFRSRWSLQTNCHTHVWYRTSLHVYTLRREAFQAGKLLYNKGGDA